MLVQVSIRLKHGVRDPEAEVIEKSMQKLGCPAKNTKQIKIIEFNLPNEYSANQAQNIAKKMAETLLNNPSIESYSIETKQ